MRSIVACRVDPALELDRLRAALGEEAAGVAKRLLGAQLPAEKRHVPDDVCAPRAPRDGSAVVDHLVDRHRKRRVEPLNDHSKRVAHEQDVDAGIVEQARERRIVCGHHGDPSALTLHFAKPGHRHGPLVGGVSSVLIGLFRFGRGQVDSRSTPLRPIKIAPISNASSAQKGS